MHALDIRPARPDEAPACIDTLVAGFVQDPGVRWMYPDLQQYQENFPRFARAFGGRAFAHGTADRIDDAAVALWLPPGVQPDEAALVNLIEASVPARDHAAVFALFEDMGRYHPREPHWHLTLIATHPTHQRRGLGAALLRHRLAACDRDGVLAYLEATSAASMPLYARHGFEALGAIAQGNSPTIVPMLRKPRRVSAMHERECETVLAE